jgi:hypothetical protein
MPLPVLALGETRVTLSCSDGTSTDLTADAPTLAGLRDAVEAMTLYPAGLSCGLVETPLLGSLATGVALAADGGTDFVVGGGQRIYCGGQWNFAINAHKHADGTVNGTINENIPAGAVDIPSIGLNCPVGGKFRSQPTCLTVAGSQAGVLTQVTRDGEGVFVGYPQGTLVLGQFTDNGPASATLKDELFFAAPATTCPFGQGTEEIAKGNILVHDDPNVP